MPEKDPPLPALAPPTETASASVDGSSRGLPLPPDQWLEASLLRVVVAVESGTTSSEAIQVLIESIRRDIESTNRRAETQRTDTINALDAINLRFKDIIESAKLSAGTNVDAKAEIGRTRDEITETRIEIGRVLDESRKIRTATAIEIDVEEGPAPRGLRIFVSRAAVHAVNTLWPFTVRMAPTLIGRVVQLAGGGVLMTALGKILHFYITHAANTP